MHSSSNFPPLPWPSVSLPPFLPFLLCLFNYHGNRWCGSSHRECVLLRIKGCNTCWCADTYNYMRALTGTLRWVSFHGWCHPKSKADMLTWWGTYRMCERESKRNWEVWVRWSAKWLRCRWGAVSVTMELNQTAPTHPDSSQTACAYPSAYHLHVHTVVIRLNSAILLFMKSGITNCICVDEQHNFVICFFLIGRSFNLQFSCSISCPQILFNILK